MKHDSRVSIARLRFLACAVAAAALTSGFTAGVAPARFSTMAFAAESAVVRGTPAATADDVSMSVFDITSWDDVEVGTVDPAVLTLALRASRCAAVRGDVAAPSTLTVIDYSKPSTKPRLWVIDLKARRLLYEELVAHGQGSGANLPTKFSNQPDSHQTSLGLFVTEATYVGRNGYSLRLDGLDEGFNDRARERAIVMHGAPYVNTQITKALGRLGRSHGCPAVREAVARELIDRVKGGSLLFAYYPDNAWLSGSKYLSSCG